MLERRLVPIESSLTDDIVVRKRFHTQIQWSEIACTLSHRKALTMAAAMECPFAIILEDDLQPSVSDPLAMMRKIFQAASRTSGASAVQFITNNPLLRQLCSNKLRLRPLNAWGTAAYVVDAAELQYLLSKKMTRRYAIAEDFLFAGLRTKRHYLYIGNPIFRYKAAVVQSDIQTAHAHALTTQLSLSNENICVRLPRCTLVSVTTSCSFSHVRLTLHAMRRVCFNVTVHVAYSADGRCVRKNGSSVVYYPLVGGSNTFVTKALVWDRLRENLPRRADEKIWFVDDDIVLSDDAIRLMGNTRAGIVQPAIDRATQWYKLFHYDSRRSRHCEVSMLEQQSVAIAADFFHFLFEHPHTRQLLSWYQNHASDWGIDCMWCELARSYGTKCIFLGSVVAHHANTHTIRKSAQFKQEGHILKALLHGLNANYSCVAKCI